MSPMSSFPHKTRHVRPISNQSLPRLLRRFPVFLCFPSNLLPTEDLLGLWGLLPHTYHIIFLIDLSCLWYTLPSYHI